MSEMTREEACDEARRLVERACELSAEHQFPLRIRIKDDERGVACLHDDVSSVPCVTLTERDGERVFIYGVPLITIEKSVLKKILPRLVELAVGP